MNNKIITIDEARSQGLRLYFTGKPCKHLHVSPRYSSNSSCAECLRVRGELKRSVNPDYNKAVCKAWRVQYPEKPRHNNAKRKASKLQRTPKWADLEAIKQKYLDCPKGLSVDHEIPMQGEFVSGLHVLENLQYMSLSENISKGNRFNYWWI